MPYNIFDAFNQGLGSAAALGQEQLRRKYAAPEEAAKLRSLLAQTQTREAQANNAPSYFSGQSNLINNQAGLAGLQEKYLPMKYNLSAQAAGSENQLRNLQMQILMQKLQQGNQQKPYSALAQMQADKIMADKMYGKNSPQSQQLDAAIKNQALMAQANAAYKNSMSSYLSNPNQQVKGLSGVGKALAEQELLNQGTLIPQGMNPMQGAGQQPQIPGQNQASMPGSASSAGLSQHSMQDVNNTYNRYLQKQSTDQFIRNKAFYAQNLEKTLQQIDPKVVTYYTGPSGQVNLKLDQAKSLSGDAPQKYLDYQNFVGVQVPTLVAQYSQYFGKSIQPSEQEKLSYIANPVNWQTSPQVALSKFESLRKLLKAETETTASELEAPINPNSLRQINTSSSAAPPSGSTYDPATGRWS